MRARKYCESKNPMRAKDHATTEKMCEIGVKTAGYHRVSPMVEKIAAGRS